MGLGSEFEGLPMEDLIGAPLKAASAANLSLAQNTATFIEDVGFKKDKDGNITEEIRMSKFAYNVNNEQGESERMDIQVPLLAMIKIPSLKVELIDITFDMEVKTSSKSSSESSKEASVEASASGGWGPYKASVTVKGSVSATQSNTRSTDKSAKYHVQVQATDSGMSEGLARVLDIMNQAIAAPTTATAKK